VTHAFGQIKDDCDRQYVVFASQGHQRLSRLRLDVRRVDHGEASTSQPPSGDVMQRGEGVVGRRLVVLVVRDQPAEAV
jgi:hypothetical protein